MTTVTTDPVAAILRPVLAPLPPSATVMCTLVSQPPGGRAALFADMSRYAGLVDAARADGLLRVARVSAVRRAPVIRVVQSAAIVVHHMGAVARVAAEGPVQRIPAAARRCWAAVVRMSESVVAVGTGGGPAGSSDPLPDDRLRAATVSLTELSRRLDELMGYLIIPMRPVGGPALPVPPALRPVRP